jgi:hypothetical protein
LWAPRAIAAHRSASTSLCGRARASGKIPNPPRLVCSDHRPSALILALCCDKELPMSHSGCLPPLTAQNCRFGARRPLPFAGRLPLPPMCRCCCRDAQAKRVPTTQGNHCQLPRAPPSSSSSCRRPPAPSATWPPLQSIVATSPRTPTQRQGPCELSPPRALHFGADRSQCRCPPYRFNMRVRLAACPHERPRRPVPSACELCRMRSGRLGDVMPSRSAFAHSLPL